jgi:hypothetical protein
MANLKLIACLLIGNFFKTAKTLAQQKFSVLWRKRILLIKTELNTPKTKILSHIILLFYKILSQKINLRNQIFGRSTIRR